MPVLEHEVHESVIAKDGSVYGCNNRPEFRKGYFAPERRYFPDGSFEAITVWIPHRMSTECRFDMSLTSSRCADCAHRGSGEAYDRTIREGGA